MAKASAKKETFERLPPNEPIIAMIELGGVVYVASAGRVFKMANDELVPVLFQQTVQPKQDEKPEEEIVGSPAWKTKRGL